MKLAYLQLPAAERRLYLDQAASLTLSAVSRDGPMCRERSGMWESIQNGKSRLDSKSNEVDRRYATYLSSI